MPTIARKSLTRRTVESASATGRLYRLRHDNPAGLVLRVSATGAKSWAIIWGRGQETVIGQFPAVTLAGAESRARAKLAEIDQHGAPLSVIASKSRSTEVRTFGDFISERYAPHVLATAKAGKATVGAINKHFAHLNDKALSAISRADFDDFKAKRLKAGLHPSTVNRDLDRIKAALSCAVEWELLANHPLRGVRRIKRGIDLRVRYLSKPESRALRKALQAREAEAKARRKSGNEWRIGRKQEPLPSIAGYSDHLMPMTLLALNTGLRRGELTQLTWTDVDLPHKLLTVRAGYAKSGRERHVQLNSEAVAVLKTWKRQHRCKGLLFNVTDVKKAWAGLMTAAGIENFRFHDLRHDFASRLVMAGVDLNTVRELLGHGDIAMTLRYAHLAPEHRAAAVEKLVS
jgi:integrase